MKNYEFITNQRNGKNLICENHIYNIMKNKENKNLWRCHIRTCTGVGEINKEDNFVCIVGHTHGDVKDKIIRLKFMQRIKLKSLKIEHSKIKIITEESKQLKEEEIKCIPLFKSVSDNITKSWNKKFLKHDGKFDDIPEF
jgi:hypothetical protein